MGGENRLMIIMKYIPELQAEQKLVGWAVLFPRYGKRVDLFVSNRVVPRSIFVPFFSKGTFCFPILLSPLFFASGSTRVVPR